MRLHSGPLQVIQTKTRRGKPFVLLDLPYFLASKIHDYLDWLMAEAAE